MATDHIGILEDKRSFGAIDLPVEIAPSTRVSRSVRGTDYTVSFYQSSTDADIVVRCFLHFAFTLSVRSNKIDLGLEVGNCGGDVFDLA